MRLHPVWTLFVRGPKHGNSWGFWEPGVGHIHNEEYKQYSPTTYIMWNPQGWWFHDESYLEHGPFKTRDEGKQRFDTYCQTFLSEKPREPGCECHTSLKRLGYKYE